MHLDGRKLGWKPTVSYRDRTYLIVRFDELSLKVRPDTTLRCKAVPVNLRLTALSRCGVNPRVAVTLDDPSCIRSKVVGPDSIVELESSDSKKRLTNANRHKRKW